MGSKSFSVLFVWLLAFGYCCKRHEEPSVKPNGTDFCGSLGDCFACSAEPLCGWCGGAGCGQTGEGCYNRSSHLHNNVCRHVEDLFITDPRICLDPCTSEARCASCLPLVLRPSMTARGMRCGWAGQCVVGTASGPTIHAAVPDWRWTNDTLIYPRELTSLCALYGSCEYNTRCGECTEAFVSRTESCVFCLDNETAVGDVGEGGGHCISASAKQRCVSAVATVLWTNKTDYCPVPKAVVTADHPMDMRGAQRQLQVLMLGLFGLFVIAILLIVNKLNE
jgi:hypothetical protein